jgi:hypothetical protein
VRPALIVRIVLALIATLATALFAPALVGASRPMEGHEFEFHFWYGVALAKFATCFVAAVYLWISACLRLLRVGGRIKAREPVRRP